MPTYAILAVILIPVTAALHVVQWRRGELTPESVYGSILLNGGLLLLIMVMWRSWTLFVVPLSLFMTYHGALMQAAANDRFRERKRARDERE